MPKELSASQSEFFKDSRIRSKDGRLLTMYHGSDSYFDEFSTPLAWFSTDRRYASEYGSHIYACYLDCRRPFVCGDTSLPLFDSGMSADDIDAGFMQAFSMGDDIDDIDFEDDAPLAYSSRVLVPSAAAEALRAKAKIGKAEFDAIVKDVMSQYSDPDADPSGLELRLDALTRSTEFKDALASRGYDSIAAREEGHLCVAAFRPESIKLVSNANPTRSRKIDEGKNACKAVCGSKGSLTVKQSNEGSKSLIRPSRGQNGLDISEGNWTAPDIIHWIKDYITARGHSGSLGEASLSHADRKTNRGMGARRKDEANRKPNSQKVEAKYSVVPVDGKFYPLESVLNACFAKIVSDAPEKGVYVTRIIKDIVGGESISVSEGFSSALSDSLAHSSDKDALIFLRRIQLTLMSHQKGTPVFSNKDNSNRGWKVSVSLEGKASLPVYELRWGKGKNNFRSTFSVLEGKLFFLTFFYKSNDKFPESEKEAAIAVVRQCFKAIPSSVGNADFS